MRLLKTVAWLQMLDHRFAGMISHHQLNWSLSCLEDLQWTKTMDGSSSTLKNSVHGNIFHGNTTDSDSAPTPTDKDCSLHVQTNLPRVDSPMDICRLHVACTHKLGGRRLLSSRAGWASRPVIVMQQRASTTASDGIFCFIDRKGMNCTVQFLNGIS